MNDNIVLDVLDAIEITEILEYMLERLDHLAAHDLSGVLDEDDTYSLDDLRTDVVRLTNKLLTSPHEKELRLGVDT